MPSDINRQVNDWRRRTKRALDAFDKKDRKRILRKSARPVVLAARASTAFRDSKKPRKYYRGNEPNRVINPGNLRRSLDLVPKLRRAQAVFVGPRAGNRARRNADGYYAQWLFLIQGRAGGPGPVARAEFNERVLQPAIRRGAPEFFAKMRGLVFSNLGNQLRKQNLT